MKRTIILLSIFAFCFLPIICDAQTTYNPSVRTKNNDGIIEKVILTSNETIVYLKMPRVRKIGGWLSFSSATVLVPTDKWPLSSARQSKLDYPDFLPSSEYASLYAAAIKRIKEGRETLSELGYLIRGLGPDKLDTKYTANQRDWYYFELHFDRLPVGVEDVYIRELVDNGFEWTGVKINNPFPTTPHTDYSEYSIKTKIDEQSDGIVGIYEGTGSNKYKLGCIKDDGVYKLIYLGSSEKMSQWRIGDVKAILKPTATPGFFKADWYMRDKTMETDWYIAFEGVGMKTVYNGGEEGYIKMYPVAGAPGSAIASGQTAAWSGSGFALKDGYLVTNYHVVDGAKTITVKGIKGDFSIAYSASVAASDKYNDLALVKINDSRFSGFGTIPYSVKTATSEVGEDVFVLGYPLTTTMGDEIKYTTGVISSKTGFQGDVSLYQISAPIQPGNSGGPLFDSRGTLIGVVNAKHQGAENVGYAIKASYLRNLIESYTSTSLLPASNTISSFSRPEQIKAIKKCVFLIECSSVDKGASNGSSHQQSSTTSSTASFATPNGLGVLSIANPQINTKGDTKAKISIVVLSDSETIVEIIANNTSADGKGYFQWCNISGTTYIVANGTKYPLIQAEGIEIAPNKTYYSMPNQDITFRLHFSAIPKNTQSIDLIESLDSEWRFFGIQLK